MTFEKSWRWKRWEKKVENSQVSWRIFKKKLSTNQIHVKRNETFWKMVADNVKTAFRLPSWVNLISNLIWQHHPQQQHQKLSTNNNKILRNWHQEVYTEKDLRPSACSFIKKRLRHRRFPVKLLGTRFYIEHLRTTASGREQDFTKNGPCNNS